MEDPQPAPVKQVLVSPSVPEPTRQASVESTGQHSGTSVQPLRPVEPLLTPDGFATPGGPPLHEVRWLYPCKGSANALIFMIRICKHISRRRSALSAARFQKTHP